MKRAEDIIQPQAHAAGYTLAGQRSPSLHLTMRRKPRATELHQVTRYLIATAEQQHEQPRHRCLLNPTGAWSSVLSREPHRPGHKPPRRAISAPIQPHPAPAFSAAPGQSSAIFRSCTTQPRRLLLRLSCRDPHCAPRRSLRCPRHRVRQRRHATPSPTRRPPHPAAHARCCVTRARRTANEGSAVSGRPSAAGRSLHRCRWPRVLLLMPDNPGYERGALAARVRHLRWLATPYNHGPP
ncbi:hypothetical protein NDU88_005054 [Pleurodeles waltl]|uniref:Uncharacterized protein n=1 Tax=Pleurodeles waltl TaxID=8319 RepID=A0AAV7LWD1_PLEWA|nr:hypothetical protein NDU88_005054 [Pleurodeles waltl]